MLFFYLPVAILALMIAVKFFSLYEREVCIFLLCWMEALAERRVRKSLRASDYSAPRIS
jgi:hypothetical protein